MDVTVAQDPQAVWIDVAVVSPSSSCPRALRQRARRDGAAARDEEGIKRRRYGRRVSPFVIEAGGRPGWAARAVLMRFAAEDASMSQEIGAAWQAVSAAAQADEPRAVAGLGRRGRAHLTGIATLVAESGCF